MNYNKCIRRIKKYSRENLSKKRYRHSLSCAAYAARLSRRFGIDRKKSYLAAIAHDIARELPHARMIKMAKADGGKLKKLEIKKPVLVHGRAAALLLKENFNIDDIEILDAVRYHTLGTEEMGPVLKIVFISDYLEPGRKFIEPWFRKKVEAMAIDEMIDEIKQHAQERYKKKHKQPGKKQNSNMALQESQEK
jgi:predicted HD superfamily hydrolase involved in NAD metabolism